MAIFRAATKHISRGKGHNVVAAAAYRAGEKLTDTNKLNPNATTHDYTKKHGVLAKNIVLPTALNNQGFAISRQELWSSVEEHETTTRSVKGSRLKQTARLAREWLLALPSELSDEENEQLTAEFTQKLADDLGVIGDYCIHKPTINNYKPKADYIESYDPDTQKPELTRVNDVKASEPDNRNIHAHIMFTTRKAEIGASGELKLGDKADSEISEKHRQERNLCNGGDYIKEIRSMWADMVNERLAQHDIAPISHKSYKDLGLDIEPQHKEGKNATVLSLYGIKTPIRIINDDIKERNRAVIKSAADSYITGHNEAAEQANTAANRAAGGTKAANEWLHKADSWLSKAAPTPFDSKQRIAELDEQTIIFDRLAERADSILARHYRAVRKLNTPTVAPTVRLSDRLTNELEKLHRWHDAFANRLDSGEMSERDARSMGQNFFISTQITCGEFNRTIARVPDKYDIEKYEKVYEAIDKLVGSVEQRMENVGLQGVKDQTEATDKLQATRQRIDAHIARTDAPAQPQQQILTSTPTPLRLR